MIALEILLGQELLKLLFPALCFGQLGITFHKMLIGF
jgi:hypothetical protein